MGEIGQRCPNCKGRFHVFVDAWADRPSLVDDALCPACTAEETPGSSSRIPARDAVQMLLFWCFMIASVSLGLVEALSR